MSSEELRRFHLALAEIDAVENENPGDPFRGRDHDRVLYGVPGEEESLEKR